MLMHTDFFSKRTGVSSRPPFPEAPSNSTLIQEGQKLFFVPLPAPSFPEALGVSGAWDAPALSPEPSNISARATLARASVSPGFAVAILTRASGAALLDRKST